MDPQLSPTQPYVLVTAFTPEREGFNKPAANPQSRGPPFPQRRSFIATAIFGIKINNSGDGGRGERPSLLHCLVTRKQNNNKRRKANKLQCLIHHLPRHPPTARPFSLPTRFPPNSGIWLRTGHLTPKGIWRGQQPKTTALTEKIWQSVSLCEAWAGMDQLGDKPWFSVIFFRKITPTPPLHLLLFLTTSLHPLLLHKHLFP